MDNARLISRTVDEAWRCLRPTKTWSTWFPAEITDDVPGWQAGGKVHRTLGGASQIASLVPKGEICITGVIEATLRLEPEGEAATWVEHQPAESVLGVDRFAAVVARTIRLQG